MTDPQLLGEIRTVLAESPFTGEGHRKVWARLGRRGVHTSRKRVLRRPLMARVEASPTEVRWGAFEQPHRRGSATPPPRAGL